MKTEGSAVVDAAKADRIAWFAYPKAGQLGTDLNRDILWRHLERVGDHFRGETVAAESDLFVVGKPRGSEQFETLLQYQVQ